MISSCGSETGVIRKGFILAVFLIFAPLTLTAQASTPSANSGGSNESKKPNPNDSADIAETLTNPLASLTSVPLENWFDTNLSPKKEGFRYTMEAQPVYPLHISANWDLITRATTPVIHQPNVIGGTDQSGLGDSTLCLFLSPVHTKSFIWGVGSDVLIPTGTNGMLSGRKLSFGPTAIGIKHKNHTVRGCLPVRSGLLPGARTIHMYARPTLSQLRHIRPRLAGPLLLNSYDTYDWDQGRWTVILNPLRVSKLVKFGSQSLSFGGTPRCIVTSPQYQPKGCGLEFSVTPVFPAK